MLQSAEAKSVTVYVAPYGSDANTGRSPQRDSKMNDGPLASLDAARLRIRQMRSEGALGPQDAVTVEFAEGEYRLEKPVLFEPVDSGAAHAPITFAAAKRARPVFFGGRRLPKFEAGDDGVWRAKIDPALRFEQLYVNGRRAVRARSPNQFYAYMQAPAPYGLDPLTGKTADLSRRAFMADVKDIAPLAGKSAEVLSDVVVTVYHSWEVSHARVQAVEPQTGRIVVTGSSPWPFFRWGRHLPRYHLENFKEALDAPGEWFLDREGTLSYLPLPGEKPGQTEAVCPVADGFLQVKGNALQGAWVSDLTFQGLSFRYAGFRLPENGQGDGQAAVSQPAAVELDGALRVAFRDCEFSHVGPHGLWFRKGCRESAVERCHLFDLGGGAVRIGDAKWSRDELPEKLTGRIVVDNNILQQGGRFFRGATGVWIGHASDVSVTHNDIGDFFYTGISMGWTWGYRETATHRNTLAFNHIHHIGWGVLSDMGGIYTLGLSEGSGISNNVIHDVYSYDYSGRGGWGLYTDEGSARMVFENNLIYRTKTGSVHQHYGRENVFRNNILALSMDGQIQRSRIEDHTSIILTNNIVYWDNASAAFWRGHAGVSGTVTDAVVNANTYWNPKGMPTNAFNCGSWEAWRAAGQDAQSQWADPLFRNVRADDFSLKASSPALKAGFKPFDAAQAGVYGARAWRKKAARTRWPEVQFAPEPQPFVVLRLDEAFDAMPLKALFPSVATHVENKGDSVAVTDEVAYSGRHALKVQDAPGLTYAYNPHFTFGCSLTNGVIENRFAVRMQSGASFFTEWRDYPEAGGNAYATGPCLVFSGTRVSARARVKKADGTLQATERTLADLPADTWAQVTVTAAVGPSADGQWSVKIARAGQPDVEVKDLFVVNPAWRAMEWLGFCSGAQSAAAYYLDDFHFGEKK